MEIKKILQEEFLDYIQDLYKNQVPVFINPSIKELRELSKDGPIRFYLHDPSKSLIVFSAEKNIHYSTAKKLKKDYLNELEENGSGFTGMGIFENNQLLMTRSDKLSMLLEIGTIDEIKTIKKILLTNRPWNTVLNYKEFFQKFGAKVRQKLREEKNSDWNKL